MHTQLTIMNINDNLSNDTKSNDLEAWVLTVTLIVKGYGLDY